MKTLRMNGVRGDAQGGLGNRPGNQIKVKSRNLVQVGGARAAAGVVDLDIEENDIVRVELAGGLDVWMRADDLYKEFGAKTTRGVADPGADTWEINLQLPADEGARGKIVQGIQALEVVGIDVVGGSAKAVAGWFEDRQLSQGTPGLYRCSLGDKFDLTPVTKSDIEHDGPILLFIHGTASSTRGSFGSLWEQTNKDGRNARKDLAEVYDKRVFAFEHRSLTESPIANALALANCFPKGAELHLVSHSRGGLVGELLCLGERDRESEFLTPKRINELFAKHEDLGDLLGFTAAAENDKEYQQQRKDLGTLLDKLDKQQLRVQRFVRVACPARGTTLASGRLDRWLSMLSHLTGEIPWIEEPLDFLLAVVKERTDPRTLPGLEAMMPGSPLIRLLNMPQLQVDSDLSVISGDLEGRSIWGKLKSLVVDWFYSGDHDLVVNTGSMYGGLKRSDGARFYFDQGHDVNHFRYFTNDRTVDKLVAGLTRPDKDAAGFISIEKARHEEPARAPRPTISGPRPIAFVLPGIMGSHLQLEGKRIWLDYWDIAMGRLEDLSIDAQRVSPDDVFEDYYGDLVDHLWRTHYVIEFPYDWRQSVLASADLLAQRIASELATAEATQQAVHIIAHSMGGLVARAMISRHPEVWRRICALPRSRLLMLGTPNGGSHEIMRLLVGQAGTLVQLALLDLSHNRNEILEIINAFPGVLELLPTEDGLNCYTPAFWKTLRRDSGGSWPLPRDRDLRTAAQTWELLRSAPVDSERMVYVAGAARTTPNAFEVTSETDFEDDSEHKFVRFFSSRRGDGKVLWETGRLAGVKTWYLEDVEHGDLPGHAPAFPAYLELLQTGRTSRLAVSPPAGARGAAGERKEILVPEVPDSLPDATDLAATVMGAGRRQARTRARLTRTRVSMVHGSLAYARHPVCVGHYQGDTIVSAEAYLDSHLDYRLSKRHQLDLYPGPPGSWEVFVNPDRYAKPGGAIVIGLGQVGALSPGNLEMAVSGALVDFALQVSEWPDDRFGGAEGVPRSARISTLLIGTGFGSLSVRNSIESILRGVQQANQRLNDAELSDKVLIDEVEFLELWQDIAINAAGDLEQSLRDGELAEHFVWEQRRLEDGEGGQRRVKYEEAPDWWHRLEIIHDAQREELRYIALTERARAEESLVSGQMKLADDFIRQAISVTRHDEEIARTLFEMLIPNRLKEAAPHQHDVVVVVDEVSARFPWELLEDRWSNRGRPLSVAAGMVRQLKTASFRQRPKYAGEECVYVVGDPQLPPATGEFPFVSLPGARAEAEAVAAYLEKRGFEAVSCIQADAGQILQGLHASSYRVLHLAGHGVHDWQTEEQHQAECPRCEQPLARKLKSVSGMVIGDRVFLTPGDIEQMRWVPELVFINCCYLGSTGASGADWERFNRLAANIGAQFIKMGVKAVVAAGWAVNDAAAKTFALSFYDHLLNGEPFGDAVRAARGETFTRHSETNTWGAYQCYGDPDYRLRTVPKPRSREHRRSFISPHQLMVELENLVKRLRMGHGEASDIDAILKAVPEVYKSEWLQRPDVAANLGLAYGELGQFRDAIMQLDHAIQENKAEFPLRVLEQRANFKSRWAVQIALGDRKTENDKTPEDLIQEAVGDLDHLVQFSETVERLSLLASAYKRRAWISSGEARRTALQSMADYYQKAHHRTYNDGKGRLDPYPLLNWLAAETLMIFPDKAGDELLATIARWCQRCEAQAEEQELQSPNFWNTIVKPDCDLVRSLAAQTLTENQQGIIEGYMRAKRRGGSQREFSSVLEQLEFLAEVVAASAKRKGKRQAQALTQIKERLVALSS